MDKSKLLIQFTGKDVSKPTLTANTSGETCARPTPDQFGRVLVNELQNEINKQDILLRKIIKVLFNTRCVRQN